MLQPKFGNLLEFVYLNSTSSAFAFGWLEIYQSLFNLIANRVQTKYVEKFSTSKE